MEQFMRGRLESIGRDELMGMSPLKGSPNFPMLQGHPGGRPGGGGGTDDERSREGDRHVAWGVR